MTCGGIITRSNNRALKDVHEKALSSYFHLHNKFEALEAFPRYFRLFVICL